MTMTLGSLGQMGLMRTSEPELRGQSVPRAWLLLHPGRYRLALLQHGQDVPGGVLEPGDVRAAGPVDALVVLVHAVVLLQVDAAPDQLVHGRVDVVHPEVEDRVGGGLV